jgi:hypothetical protein
MERIREGIGVVEQWVSWAEPRLLPYGGGRGEDRGGKSYQWALDCKVDKL